ncbi:hypothetical protein JOC37_002264 [Desulfohalotomaculum tongense]|nr:hypothetical protein [Desulforadius tongensis]
MAVNAVKYDSDLVVKEKCGPAPTRTPENQSSGSGATPGSSPKPPMSRCMPWAQPLQGCRCTRWWRLHGRTICGWRRNRGIGAHLLKGISQETPAEAGVSLWGTGMPPIGCGRGMSTIDIPMETEMSSIGCGSRNVSN